MQSLHQQRANKAWEPQNNAILADCADLPNMLRQNGFLATLAHLCDKKRHNVIQALIRFVNQDNRLNVPNINGNGDLTPHYLHVRTHLEQNPGQLMPLTATCIEFSEALKQAFEAQQSDPPADQSAQPQG